MMKNKAKTELSKMTKRDLLLHIENMQLETQKSNKELTDTASKHSSGSTSKTQRAAGVLRYQVSQYDFDSIDDKKKILKMVDNFINKMV
jgi:hypothetical protein